MTWALLALVVALALFWLSTRQWPTLVRLAIWSAGLAALFWFTQADGDDSFGLGQALTDAWAHRADFSEAAIVQAFRGNAETIAQFIPQLSEFYVIACAAMALLAFIALSPGERLERALRPAILTIIGFIAGATATLAVVAIGLGGQVRAHTHLGYVDAADVYDGDTFALGDFSMRLYAVDAPERDQTCRVVEELTTCGEQARAKLAELLADSIVQCVQKYSIRSQRPQDSFGRPLVECHARQGAEIVNVGRWMIEQGYAVHYINNQGELGVEDNFTLGCTLRPEIWRGRTEQAQDVQVRFARGARLLPEHTMGACAVASEAS